MSDDVHFTWTVKCFIRLHYAMSPVGGTQAHWVQLQIECLITTRACFPYFSVLFLFFSCFCCYYKVIMYVYISSWRSWLQRRCICLHGVNGLEDQGGRKGQKMTSEPSAQLPLADQESTCFSELQVNALLGNEEDFFFYQRGPESLLLLLDWMSCHSFQSNRSPE